AQAWGDLADVLAFAVFTFESGMDDYRAKAKSAIDRAVELAPDDTDVIRSLGTYYYYASRDYVQATEQYEKLARRQPNDPTVFNSLGLIQRRQGNWAQALLNQRRASELDPANIKYLRNLLATEQAGNHYDQVAALQRRISTLLPGNIAEGYFLAQISFLARGSTVETDAYFAHLSLEEANSPAGLNWRRDWAALRGDYAEAIRLDRLQPYYDGTVFTREEQAMLSAQWYFAVGDHAGMVARLGDATAVWRRQLELEPKNARTWIVLGLAEALLGNKAEAVRCAEHGKQLNPESQDALDGIGYASIAAAAYDWTGDKEKALAEYARLLRKPYGMNVHTLEHSVSTLHGDARFEALVKDPANNAPQF
ncbi:MAG: Tetratricopeptide repeat protein, partial [Verrucomicrobia bacterium]|nr:Tetratricopeptide repeat protein [Verrucomicrobiota bacterium]